MTLIVPYRDRAQHLENFIPAIQTYLPDAQIVVVEQVKGKDFNRGKLINIGFLETKAAYFCAHDVDMLPMNVDYSPSYGITQLASSAIQLQGYLGGVTMFDRQTFENIGGYHNDFFHRAEDNELMFNLHRLRVFPKDRHGTFINLPHERTGPEFIPHLWIKAQQQRKVQDQLSICEYEVLKKVNEENYTHLTVKV